MQYRVGKADIRQLDITSNVTKSIVDISHIIHQISVYEDMYASHMTCNIAVFDGVSLRSLFPITGGEETEINIGERGDQIRELKGKFVVYSMSAKTRSKPDVEYYMLHLLTHEQLIDHTKMVKNSFKKPIHQIVQDIVTQYFTPVNGKKLITVEETEGLFAFVPASLTPTSILKQCCREAQSHDNPSSTYVFFETVEGYHFATLEYLYKQKPSQVFMLDELIDTEANPTGVINLVNNISDINFNNEVNLLNGQFGGRHNRRTHHFDPLTKSFRTTNYVANNNLIALSVRDKYFNEPTISDFIVTDSHRKDVNYVKSKDPDTANFFRRRQNFLGKERGSFNQFGSIRITISVPGNSTLTVGQTAYIILPYASDTVQDKILNDPLMSGKYLVAAIAHNIDGVTGYYRTVAELIRPEFEESLQ